MTAALRLCKRCRVEKPDTDEHWSRSKTNRSWCKPCMRAYWNERAAALRGGAPAPRAARALQLVSFSREATEHELDLLRAGEEIVATYRNACDAVWHITALWGLRPA